MRTIERLMLWWSLVALASCFGLLAACGTSMGSIGAMLGKDHHTGRVTVRDVPPGMGAARAGLVANDQILLIDGRDVRRMTAEEIHEALVGPVGSKVSLTLEREGKIVRVEVKRGPLKN